MSYQKMILDAQLWFEYFPVWWIFNAEWGKPFPMHCNRPVYYV